MLGYNDDPHPSEFPGEFRDELPVPPSSSSSSAATAADSDDDDRCLHGGYPLPVVSSSDANPHFLLGTILPWKNLEYCLPLILLYDNLAFFLLKVVNSSGNRCQLVFRNRTLPKCLKIFDLINSFQFSKYAIACFKLFPFCIRGTLPPEL